MSRRGRNVGYVPPSYRPLSTRRRQYPCWFLLDRQGTFPIALKRSDARNEAVIGNDESRDGSCGAARGREGGGIYG
jgi:hypothetical protein